jgi:hypothetical protein
MRFGTMGTTSPGLGREGQGGPTMSRPTRPKEMGQESRSGTLITNQIIYVNPTPLSL